MNVQYEIVRYSGNAVLVLSQHETLIQADDVWRRCDYSKDKRVRIFKRWYSLRGYKYLEETITGYNTP